MAWGLKVDLGASRGQRRRARAATAGSGLRAGIARALARAVSCEENKEGVSSTPGRGGKNFLGKTKKRVDWGVIVSLKLLGK